METTSNDRGVLTAHVKCRPDGSWYVDLSMIGEVREITMALSCLVGQATIEVVEGCTDGFKVGHAIGSILLDVQQSGLTGVLSRVLTQQTDPDFNSQVIAGVHEAMQQRKASLADVVQSQQAFKN